MRRHTHSLNHHHLFTADMGYLVPAMCVEVLPGDTFNMQSALLVRVAPLVTPVMHPVDIRLHFWYVPNRLVWDQFGEFISGSLDVQAPTITVSTTTQQDFVERFGVRATNGDELNALPFRAYNLIWNERYRDQDLSTAAGEDDLLLKRIAWEKDYFTTARPQATIGDTIDVPFSFEGNNVEVQGLYGKAAPNDATGYQTDGTSETANQYYKTLMAGGSATANTNDWTPPYVAGSDISSSGGIDIDDLRRSLALQRFAEARARFGPRFEDYLRYLGVNPSDQRLQKPEPLGSGKATISFSEVLATAEGTNTLVGDLAGHGIGALRSRRMRKGFEEHGWVIGLFSVRPKTIYAQAVPRCFTRSDAMDYWQKELEVMPWQEVYQREVHRLGSASTIFGYVPKYDEYRHQMSYVSGEMLDTTMSSWHMARDPASAPTLNQSFIECAPTDRIYGDTTQPELVVSANHTIRARRFVSAQAGIGKGLI